MAQHDYGNPQPPFSGTQLNTTLRNWRDALHTLHRGPSRPSYVQGGMLWIREVSSTNWELTLYDGADDIVIATINPSTNVVTPAGAATPADLETRVAKAGDTMTGALTLSGAPTAANHAATKAYVDAGDNTRVAKAGDTMTGFLTLHADPTAAMHAVTKQYVDRGYSSIQNVTNVTAVDFTGIPSWANSILLYVYSMTTTSHSLRVRIGDANGFITSNYVSRGSTMATGVSSASATDCFLTSGNEMSAVFVAFFEIKRQRDLNRWAFTSIGSHNSPGAFIAAGRLNQDLVLDRVRLYVPSGTMTGQCHVEWRR